MNLANVPMAVGTCRCPRREVIAKADALLKYAATGQAVRIKGPLGEYLNDWLDHSTDVVQLRPSSRALYRRHLPQHIQLALGSVRLPRLTPVRSEEFHAEKIRAGLGPKTVESIRAVLHRALGRAVKHELLPRNPARRGSSCDREPIRCRWSFCQPLRQEP